MVANSGKLSTMSTTASNTLTDKVDSPHSGLFTAIHSMTQGNYALKDHASTLGFAHTFAGGGSPTVAVTAGKAFFDGKYVTVDALSASALTKPSSGARYHWVVAQDDGDGTYSCAIVMGGVDGVVPDLNTTSVTVEKVPISLIKVQSTDTASTVAVQYFTTSKEQNSLSVGYSATNVYTEASSITGTAAGLFISGIGTATVAGADKVLIQDAGSSDVIKSVTASSLASVLGTPAVLTGSTNNTITTVTGANAITGEANLTFDGSDLKLLEAANDGNPSLSVGSADAEKLLIQSVFDSGAQTLDYVKFSTAVASSSANKGKYIFDVDGTTIATIDDGGVDLASGKTFAINGTDIVSSPITALNSATANELVTVGATTTELDAEANLTFNATTLAVTGNQTISPANDVGAAALTITNADTDQIALDINAANITADVIDVTANDLTTSKVMNISATGLTDGMLFNAATTSTVTDGGTSTLVSTAMTNDGVGSQTAKGLLLDYNKTGITASGKTVNLTGMHIDIDDSVTNVGTVNVTGLDIDCNFGNTGGAVKNIGLDVAVAGADNNYAALFSGGFVGMGTTTPVSLLHLKTSAAFDPTTSTVASMYNNLLIDGSAASSGDGNFGGAIAFTGVGSGRRRAAIAAVQTTSDSDEVGLSFFTHDAASPSTNEAVIEQMRITDSGRIGIGTITPMNRLQINHTGIDANNGMLIIRADTSTADGDLLGGIGFDSTDGNVPSAVTEASAFITSYATEAHATTDKGGNIKFGVSLIDEDDDVVSTTLANVGPPDTTANATCYAGLNSRATTAIVAAATYAPTVTDSGTLVVFEHANSNLTLPSINNTSSVGVQFTVFNETGSAIESQIATSDSATINGAAAGAPNDDIASYKAATFVCSGNNTWIRIG